MKFDKRSKMQKNRHTSFDTNSNHNARSLEPLPNSCDSRFPTSVVGKKIGSTPAVVQLEQDWIVVRHVEHVLVYSPALIATPCSTTLHVGIQSIPFGACLGGDHFLVSVWGKRKAGA